MKIAILVFFSIVFLASCLRKKINEKTFSAGDITISWYHISEITTAHDFIDLKRGGNIKNIMEANTDGVYDIFIKEDTIIIRTTPELLVYKLDTTAFDYHIKQDSSVSIYEYLKKYNPAGAEAFRPKSAAN